MKEDDDIGKELYEGKESKMDEMIAREDQIRKYSEKKERWNLFLAEMTQLGKKHNVIIEGSFSISDLDLEDNRSNWVYVRLKHSTVAILQEERN